MWFQDGLVRVLATQRATGVTPPVKVGIVLALFIYWLTKDIKLTAQIILAHMILHAIFK